MNHKRLCIIFILALVVFYTVFDSAAADVTVYGDHVSQSFKNDVQDYVTNSIDMVSQVLGVSPQEPVDVVLTSSDEEYQQLTGDILPEWSSAVAIGNSRIVVAPMTGWTNELNRVIVHEVVHIVIAGSADDRFVPRWFHEGCAQYLSAEWSIRNRLSLVWHTIAGDALSFSDIEKMLTADNVNATLGYDQSLYAIRHLRSRHGEGIIADIVAGLENSHTFSEAFVDATGVWPSEFEEDYLKRLNEVYGWRSLYLLIPSIWTFILILAFIAYFVKRHQTRKILSTWEIIEAAEKIVNFEEYRNRPEL